MKRIVLFLFFISSNNFLFSQNYRLVNLQRSSYYSYFDQEINKTTVCVIDIDSSSSSGIDSLFFNYKSLYNLNSSGCNDVIDTGFIGHHFVLKPNGETVFLNENNDSVIFHPYGNLNHSWMMFDLGGGNSYQATIISIATENILGVIDSVKTILIQPSSPGIFTGKQIKIGKNFGFIQTYNLLRFPDDTTTYRLEGISNPDFGIRNINMYDIFNFIIGDTIQLYGEFSYDVPHHLWTWEQKNILSKYESANNDTVIYDIEKIYFREEHYFTNVTTSFSHDTSQFVYIISEDSVFNKRPLEFIIKFQNYYAYSSLLTNDTLYNSRQKKNLEEYASFDQSNHCIFNGGGWCYIPTKIYTEGLGQTYFTLDGGSCGNEHLIYFHKGNEIWGTGINWSGVLGNKENQNDYNINIYPNPFSDIIKINFAVNLKTKGTLKIQNIYSQTLYSITFEDQNQFEVPVKEFNKGVYILTISIENQLYNYKLIKY